MIVIIVWCLELKKTWVLIPTLPSMNYKTLGELHTFSEL